MINENIKFLIFYLVQMLILQYFCGYEYFFEGITMIGQAFSANDWKQTGHFPRVTLCDISIRYFGVDRKAIVQCINFTINILRF